MLCELNCELTGTAKQFSELSVIQKGVAALLKSPNSKKDPKTTKPQAVEKNANRRDPTGKSALKISA